MVYTAGDEQSAVPRFPGLCVGCFRRLPLKYKNHFRFLKHDESFSAASKLGRKIHFDVIKEKAVCATTTSYFFTFTCCGVCLSSHFSNVSLYPRDDAYVDFLYGLSRSCRQVGGTDGNARYRLGNWTKDDNTHFSDRRAMSSGACFRQISQRLFHLFF